MTSTSPCAATTSVTSRHHLDPPAPPRGPRPGLIIVELAFEWCHVGCDDREAATLQEREQVLRRSDWVGTNPGRPFPCRLRELVRRAAQRGRRRRARSR